MKQLCLALVLICGPASSQEAPTVPAPQDQIDEGADLLQRGMRSILEGFFTEMQPAIEDMGRALSEMRPMAEDLMRLMDNIGNYEAPVVLENGDILIRRKPPPPEPLKEGEIEL